VQIPAEEESMRLDVGIMGNKSGRCVPEAVERLLVLQLLSLSLLPQALGAVRAFGREKKCQR
jgi:hypothetical protein